MVTWLEGWGPAELPREPARQTALTEQRIDILVSREWSRNIIKTMPLE